jgi:hypothetical protein
MSLICITLRASGQTKTPNRKAKQMAKKATGNKKGQKAFALLQEWRKYEVPELITSYEAYHLTGGIVGKPASSTPMRLIEVAVKYASKGGSVHDWWKTR